MFIDFSFESAVFLIFFFFNLVITALMFALGAIWTKFMEDLPIFGTRLVMFGSHWIKFRSHRVNEFREPKCRGLIVF